MSWDRRSKARRRIDEVMGGLIGLAMVGFVIAFILGCYWIAAYVVASAARAALQ